MIIAWKVISSLLIFAGLFTATIGGAMFRGSLPHWGVMLTAALFLGAAAATITWLI